MARLLVTLSGLLLLVASGPVCAQEMYDSSMPSEGDVLKASPEPMVINFLTAIHVTGLRLVGADGVEWPLEWSKTDENVFKVEFRPSRPVPPGRYQIEWSAYVRQHYHPDGGVITFTLAPQSATSGAAIPAEAMPAGGAPPVGPDLPDRAPRAAAATPSGR
jgi:methionine-rich copper-binding protein CopC